ncbi:MAG: restriction endonuclease [Spirochaetia bacterium]|nr:restriction endonuclease [Spirochaetia bacterium]
MIAGIVVIVVIAIIILILLYFSPSSQKEKAYKDAIDSYNNHLYSESLKKFQNLLNDEPYNSFYHWYVALCAIQRQEFTNAMYHLESILQINNYTLPEELPDTEIFNEIGVNRKLMEIYETLKIQDKLLMQYEKLMELDKNNEEYPLKIAQSLIDNKVYSDQVKEYLEKTLNINPKNGTAQFLLSLIYHKRNEFDNALQCAEKAIALDKSLSDASFIMGYARYRLNLKDEAEKLFREATLCKYFKKSTAFYLAKLIASSGKIDFALPYASDASKFSKSIHEDPSLELESMYQYATLLEESNHYDDALVQYQAIQNIQPDYQDVSKRLKYMQPINSDNSNHRTTVDLLDIYKKMKHDEFAHTSESVVENMGYKVKKVDLVNDQTINMLAHKTDEASDHLTGVYIRRGIGIIQEDHIKSIMHFMSGMQVTRAVLITPNDFNPTARKMAEKKGIKTINAEQLIVLLNKIIK